jgi:aminopeptidase N
MPRRRITVGRRTLTIVALALAGALAGAGPAAADRFVAGSPGLGDPFFPLAGNGGYDVRHYALDLDYRPGVNRLEATARIRARATLDLDQFDLDLRGFDIRRLTVDGHRARFSRDGQELVIQPRPKLRAGRRFVVEVHYAGTPSVVTDPDGSIEGWVPTGDGAFVVGEPQGSPGWYPANDNPRDKASYSFRVTVPEGITAMANGVLEGRATRRGRTTWRWRERLPMAPYLATVTSGRFDLRISRTPGGLPIYDAVDPTQAADAAPVLAKQPAILAFFSRTFGPYPFEAAGAIVDDAPEVGYALETQTKPVYSSAPDESTVAHELAHQWYGDAVTLTVWPDIWLNEGFATWAEWLWEEHEGGTSAQARFERLYATPATNERFWNPPPANPGEAANLFDGTIYTRGAMTLQALRAKLGDPTFLRIMRAWYREHRYGNVTTADFVALAERVSARQLDAFFQAWLYQPGKPAAW